MHVSIMFNELSTNNAGWENLLLMHPAKSSQDHTRREKVQKGRSDCTELFNSIDI